MSSAQVSRLREEILEISRANEVYESNKHHRSLWYQEQQKLRRQRLLVIKMELMQLMSKATAATYRIWPAGGSTNLDIKKQRLANNKEIQPQ